MLAVPESINQAIALLENAGFEAYIVGGSTRDSLRGIPPHDYDLTTSAKPEEMKSVFANFKYIETGIKHGTLTVLFYSEPIEITTFREDLNYEDHRHPSEVCYTKTLKEDLARRDFTMNAIAYSPSKGYIDPFHGTEDISKKIIRTVGEPTKRFNEDALRILRALRFSSTLGFDIEEETKLAIHKLYPSLSYISKERIQVELSKFLTGVNRLPLLHEFFDVFSYLIPELKALPTCEQNTPYHTKNVFEHTLDVMGNLPPEVPFQLAALFHDIAKPEMKTTDEAGVDHFKKHAKRSAEIAKEIMLRYKFSNKEISKVTSLIQFHDLRPSPNVSSALHLLYLVSEEGFSDQIQFCKADYLSHNLSYPNMLKSYQNICDLYPIGLELIEKKAPFTIQRLAIKGSDLSIFPTLPKNKYKNILEELLFAVMDFKVENNKEDLLLFTKENLLSD